MDKPEKVTGTSEALSRVQDRIHSAIERKKNPFEDGRPLKFEFDADAGKVTIRRIHGLGRKPTGFLVTDVETNNVLDAAHVIRTFSSKYEIELQLVTQNGTGKYTYRVLVY